MWLYVYIYVYKMLFTKSLDNTLIWLQWHKYDEAFGAHLSTHKGFGPCAWVLLSFGH